MRIELDENGLNANANKTGDEVNLHDRINEAYNGTLGEAFQNKTKKRVDWVVKQSSGKNALDVGCSQGIVPILLAQKGVQVLGVDIDQQVVDDANKALSKESAKSRKRISFVQADFLEYEFNSTKFDTVVFTEFLEHLYDPEVFIKRAHELTNAKGQLIVTVPFGINDHPDHRQNFYLNELYGLLSLYYKIKHVEIIEKWIGFVAEKKAITKSSETPPPKLLEEAEQAFYRIERSLTTDLRQKKNALAEKNKRYTLLASEVRDIKRELEEKKQKTKLFMEQRNEYRNSIQYRIGSILTYPFRRIVKIPPVRVILLRAYYFVFPGKKIILEGSKITYGDLFSSPVSKNFSLGKHLNNMSKDLRIASIVDEFSQKAFAHDCTLLQLTPDNWLSEISNFKPDMLFVESAWRGKDGLWREHVSKNQKILAEVARYCQQEGIPTVFWNKEDPAHTAHFLPVASLFDFVFTTDMNCIPTYRDTLGHSRVRLLPFAAQPKINNPIEKYVREDKVSFAGSYYAKYRERSENFSSLVNGLRGLKDVDIFDRNFGKGLGSKYEFPREFADLVRGTLPYEQIDKAYKGYNYAININTIKHSPTMFARRVFELLASNTVTISNYSKGIANILGDLVVSTDDGKQAAKILQKLTLSDYELRRFRLRGLRAVLQNHTYQHRLKEICRVVFYDYQPLVNQPQIVVVSNVSGPEEAYQVLKSYNSQTYTNTRLVLISDKELMLRDLGASTETQLKSELQGVTVGNFAKNEKYIAVWNADDFYGPNFLLDLALADSYSNAPVFGKAAYYKKQGKAITLNNDKTQYYSDQLLEPSTCLLAISKIKEQLTTELIEEMYSEMKPQGLSLSEFEYCKGGANGLTAKQKKRLVVEYETAKSLSKLYSKAERQAHDKNALRKIHWSRLLRIRRTLPFTQQF